MKAIQYFETDAVTVEKKKRSCFSGTSAAILSRESVKDAQFQASGNKTKLLRCSNVVTVATKVTKHKRDTN